MFNKKFLILFSASSFILGITLFAFFSYSYRYTEMLSGLRLIYLWLSIILLIPALIFLKTGLPGFKKWTPFLLTLLALVLNGIEVLPYYLPVLKSTDQVQPKLLKVMLFNVLYTNQQYSDLFNLIQKEQPEVAVFLEAAGRWPDQLNHLAHDYPYHRAVPQMEVEVYSKYPLINEEIILYGTYRGFVPLQLLLNGEHRTELVVSHAYPPRYYGDKGFKLRNRQITEGIPGIASAAELPLIVLGDFNMDMWSGYFRKMISDSGLHNARMGFGVLPTLWINNQLPLHSVLGLPVDHCLVSSEISVRRVYSGPHIGSDHLPLFIVLEIPVKKS